MSFNLLFAISMPKQQFILNYQKNKNNDYSKMVVFNIKPVYIIVNKKRIQKKFPL
jgi:hypothetical protein